MFECYERLTSATARCGTACPNSHVLLVPKLQGGWAGWCLATGYQTKTEGSGGCGELTTASTGPIFAEEGCDESETGIHLYALTTSEVAVVSVYGGTPIPTTTNATLPDGLRAAAVEVLRHKGHPSVGSHCPRMRAFDGQRKLIGDTGKRAALLRFASRLPGVREWRGVSPVSPLLVKPLRARPMVRANSGPRSCLAKPPHDGETSRR